MTRGGDDYVLDDRIGEFLSTPKLFRTWARVLTFIGALVRQLAIIDTRACSFHRSAVPLPPGGRLRFEAFSHPCEKYGSATSYQHIKATTTKSNVFPNLFCQKGFGKGDEPDRT